MHQLPADASDLTPNDLRIIAGLAGGLRYETIDDYLTGRRETQRSKRRAIEDALRAYGAPHLIRPRGLAKTG